jgi:hypothetical protein
MMHGASGDECGNLLGQEYNRPARGQSVEKAPGRNLTFFNLGSGYNSLLVHAVLMGKYIYTICELYCQTDWKKVFIASL